MNDCSQGNLTGSIALAGISKEDRVKEGLDLRPEAVHTVHCADGGGDLHGTAGRLPENIEISRFYILK